MTDSRFDADQNARNLALIERYFGLMASGDPELASLFADDARWVTPASSPMAGPFEGKAAVLELMGGGIGLYDAEYPFEIHQDAAAATGESVFVEMTMTARTSHGEPYKNRYVFVFTIREGLICEVHEHLDTLYAQKLLFDPVGQRSPLDADPTDR